MVFFKQVFTLKWAGVLVTGGVLLLSAALLQASGAGDSDDDEHHKGRKGMRLSNANWKAECSECHIAYPPGMLPRESWQALMGDLSNHFGTDASLDTELSAEIMTFLTDNAGRSRGKTLKPDLRITETRWFIHEHDEIPNRVWQRPSVQSKSNCLACHTSADKGDFDEDNVRIPR